MVYVFSLLLITPIKLFFYYWFNVQIYFLSFVLPQGFALSFPIALLFVMQHLSQGWWDSWVVICNSEMPLTSAVMCSVICPTSGFDANLDVQGELILQDTFQVWDPKSLIRKGRDRHLFLFEISLVFSKEIKDSAGRSKYIFKNKLLVIVKSLTHN